ncbi:RNA polymerase sigma factor [Streptosporangium canum]|uniref:RNA polymerase sigma factor n=1 Tax=Streptosporangium canum TaxID=324952 RepID=UPI0037966834
MTDRPPHTTARPAAPDRSHPTPPTPHRPTSSALPPAEQLCQRYGDALVDYARTWLAAPDLAADTVRHALTLARQNPQHLPHPSQHRAWLYALTRLLAATADSGHAFSTGPQAAISDTPRATPPSEHTTTPQTTTHQLAADALSALDRRDRELLELGMRHHLDITEISMILQQDPSETATALTAACDLLEAWASAVRQAGKHHPTCPQAAALATEWATSPSRGIRTKIRTHVKRCLTCGKAAHITVTATSLMQHLPITPLTPTHREHLPHPAAPPDTPITWSSTGFPLQPDQDLPDTTTSADPALEGFRANADTDFWAEASDHDFWTDAPTTKPPATATPHTTSGDHSTDARSTAAHPSDGKATLATTAARFLAGDRLRPLRTAALTAASLLICLAVWSWTGPSAPAHTASTQPLHPPAVPSQDPLPLETAPPPPPPLPTPAEQPTTTPARTPPPPQAPAKARTPPSTPPTPKRATPTPPIQIQPNSPGPRRPPPAHHDGPNQPPPPPDTSTNAAALPATLTASTTTVDLSASGTAHITLSATGHLTWSATPSGSPAPRLSSASGTLAPGQSTSLQILAPDAASSLDYGACAVPLTGTITIRWSADNDATSGEDSLTITVRSTRDCG